MKHCYDSSMFKIAKLNSKCLSIPSLRLPLKDGHSESSLSLPVVNCSNDESLWCDSVLCCPPFQNPAFEECDNEDEDFTSLGLEKNLVAQLNKMGFERPTNIQVSLLEFQIWK